MNYSKVELHIFQVEKVIDSSRKDFPEAKKQEIYDGLMELFKAVKSKDLFNLTTNELEIARDALIDIFNGIEHLHYVNASDLPIELIYCLDLAIDDWIDDSQDYFVAVSYNNSAYNFYIIALDEQSFFRKQINYQTLFGKQYKQLLIQISKPKAVQNDFLGSNPVYHELGHFIDLNYQITRSLYRDPTYRTDLVDDHKTQKFTRSEHIIHLGEFFSDIFSAQYLGNSSTKILDYIAYNSKGGFTHPSTDKRISVVNTFLMGTGPKEDLQIIDALKKSTINRTNGRELKVRYDDNYTTPFNGLTPIYLDTPPKIHGLLIHGWEYLESGLYIQEDKNDPTKKCERINKLIRESISLSMP
jgi:hypothetical protein